MGVKLEYLGIAGYLAWSGYKSVRAKIGQRRGRLSKEFWLACLVVVTFSFARLAITTLTEVLDPFDIMRVPVTQQGVSQVQSLAKGTDVYKHLESVFEQVNERGNESIAIYWPHLGSATLRCLYCKDDFSDGATHTIFMSLLPPHLLRLTSYVAQILLASSLCHAAWYLQTYFLLLAVARSSFEVSLIFLGPETFWFRNSLYKITEIGFMSTLVGYLWLETRYLSPNRPDPASLIRNLRLRLSNINTCQAIKKEVFNEIMGSEDLSMLFKSWARDATAKEPIDSTTNADGPVRLIKQSENPTTFKLNYQTLI